ncbi:hypothetical protein [Thermoactinospora rubra]|uniref:hypothetical protein n=1 Tax=Thermoactinospora rubra TaxID=1088767 RepID=UPI000A105F35|nr:hypothetical protein [Thermoactinospora rubra]
MSTGDELRAAVEARRELGPEFEDSVVESFLDKMGKEIDRRVEERLAAAPKQSGTSAGMRLALAIVSLSLGTIVTIALLVAEADLWGLLVVWGGIALVNWVFNQR